MFAPVAAAVEAGLNQAGQRALTETELPAFRLRMSNLIGAQMPPFGDRTLSEPGAHLLTHNLFQLSTGGSTNDGGGNEVLAARGVVG